MILNGKLITLEGLDGSGKGTQAQLLYQALTQRGVQVKKVSFPCYQDPSSTLVRMYLSGAFGRRPQDVNAYAASVFYAVDRYASYRQDWQNFYQTGGVVLADRYTTANAVHQCSKLPQTQWNDFLDWLFDLEYNKMGLPTPDAVFFLDMEPAISQRLLAGRYQGSEAKKDIHERDAAYLTRSREAALYCARRLGWQRVCCDDGAQPLPPQEIHAQLLQAVLEILDED